MTIDEVLARINKECIAIRVTNGGITASDKVSPSLFAGLKEHRAKLISVFGDPLVQKVLNTFKGSVVHVS
jgi:hypothetical protein